MIASMPLICCNTSNVRPIASGINTGREKNFIVGWWIFDSTCFAWFVALIDMDDACWAGSFSHSIDFSAALNWFLLRNHTGESTINSIKKPHRTKQHQTKNGFNFEGNYKDKSIQYFFRLYWLAIEEQNHARLSHFVRLPIMYAIKIPTDMKIVGKLPNTPRILESQHSPI